MNLMTFTAGPVVPITTSYRVNKLCQRHVSSMVVYVRSTLEESNMTKRLIWPADYMVLYLRELGSDSGSLSRGIVAYKEKPLCSV